MEKNQIWTIRKIIDWSKQYFETHHIDTPQIDVQILLGHVLNMSKVQLILNADRPLNADELAEYKRLIIRRAKNREPIAYILGEKDFWSLNLKVTPDVLIPRPDTECLVEKAIDFANFRLSNKRPPWMIDPADMKYETVDERKAYYSQIKASDELEQKTIEWLETSAERLKNLSDEEKLRHYHDEVLTQPDETDHNAHSSTSERLHIVDVGTGSGAIILAIASEVDKEKVKMTAIDISPEALTVAIENAEKTGMKDDISFIQSDLLANFNGKADLIVSNPPYISTSEMSELAPEVKREPVLALEAGSEGLDIYRRLVPQALSKLTQGGALIVEIGYSQSAAVESIFLQNGLTQVQTFKDYGKHPRVVFGVKE